VVESIEYIAFPPSPKSLGKRNKNSMTKNSQDEDVDGEMGIEVMTKETLDATFTSTRRRNSTTIPPSVDVDIDMVQSKSTTTIKSGNVEYDKNDDNEVNQEGMKRRLSASIDTAQQSVPFNILEARPLDKSNTVSSKPHIPSVSASAVLGESLTMPENTLICRGVDFNTAISHTAVAAAASGSGSGSGSGNIDMLDHIMNSFASTGFQATNLALAVQQIHQMRQWRLSHVPWQKGDDIELQPPAVRERLRARIFFAYTSNQISSGQREVLRFLAQHRMVDVIVTTAGGIEEDLIKCFRPTYMGDFKLNGRDLRLKGINRIGNLLVPNANYCEFEDWVTPLIETMHQEQDEKWAEWALNLVNKRKQQARTGEIDDDTALSEKFVWTPSKFIRRLGLEINNEDSVLYWAAKNEIPIFCPALTDGSVGDMLYFHSYKSPGFVLDINEDIRRINDLAVRSHATGMIILGGGLIKHHTCNANLMRNGADFAVYVNTAQEFDGSDSGASPEEAISWGKIRITAKPVKVSCDATIAFPLIVSQTFAKDVEKWKKETKGTACFIDDLNAVST
jgi:deoxyhypusine synthase